jgi:short-subunit dehydrogenase
MSTQKSFALITGATSGIGKELAKLFVKDGHNVVIVARDEAELSATAAELKSGNAEVITIAKDLFQKDSAAQVYDLVKAKGIQIDTLVNDAGQGVYGLFAENDLQRELDIIHLNICSLVTLTKLFVKDFIARGSGRILNVGSIAGTAPGPYQAVYHGTKAFVNNFSEGLRSEVKDQGITVTVLLPGVTDTDFFNKAGMQDSKAVQDKDKMADPADVAKDGYDALMNGDDKVVSGFSNKMQVAMGSITPDSVIADKTKKTQEPVDK